MRNLIWVMLASCAWGAPDLNRLPLGFEPNRGQAPAGARYVAQARGYAVLLESAGLRLRAKAGTVRMRFAGARRDSAIEAERLLPGKANYLRGNDPSHWLTRIPTYSEIRYRDLYPGIDLLCHGNQGNFEYDFVVSPGARPSAIRLDFSGIDRLRIERNGDLVLESGGRRIVHRPPVAYQQVDGARRPVAGRYVRRGARSAGFALGPYDRTRPVIIDPTLVYSTLIGDVYQIAAAGVAADAKGNAYVVGSRLDVNFQDQDFFVIEVDPTGTNVVNLATFGGSGDDVASGIAVDAAGNMYVTGSTQSQDMPVGGAVFQRTLHGQENAYVAAIKSDFSALIFATFLGGSNADEAFAIALDGSGNVFVAGRTISSDFPSGSAAYQRKGAGGVDAFLAKFSAAGAAQFITYFGGSGDESANGLAVDSSGSAYIAGSTTSTNLPVTGGVLQSSNAGAMDAYVAKFSGAGSLVYATYFGGSNDEVADGVAVDSSGNAYISGVTTSTNLPGAGNAAGGGQDAFAAKLNPAGSALLWSTYLAGSGDERATAIAVDGAGNAYAAGTTNSQNFPVTADAYQGTTGVAATAFVSQLSGDAGSLIYSTFLGGSGGTTASGIAAACATGIYVAGATQSTDFPVSSGVVGTRFTGIQDGFLARFSGAGGPPSISANGVVNGANFAPAPVAPGSLISIFGANLAGAELKAGGTPLPTTLGGVSVSVNGVKAPLVFVSPVQINAQLPFEAQPGTAQVAVSGCGPAADPMPVTVGAAAPATFQTSGGHAILQNQDGSANDSSHPAKPGTTVTVYLTGIGAVSNQPPTGSPAAPDGKPLSTAALPFEASIGGQPAVVQFLGIAPGFVGLAQANVTVPAVAAGELPLIISVGGVASNPATISIAGP